MPTESKFNVNGLYNEVLEGSVVKLLFANKTEFESVRVTFLRKFKRYKALLESLGGPNFLDGKFMRCSFNGAECSGTFSLEAEEKRKNLPGKMYTAIVIKRDL